MPPPPPQRRQAVEVDAPPEHVREVGPWNRPPDAPARPLRFEAADRATQGRRSRSPNPEEGLQERPSQRIQPRPGAGEPQRARYGGHRPSV